MQIFFNSVEIKRQLLRDSGSVDQFKNYKYYVHYE
jgi:hypothetical protein